ncbi:MAG TPA: UDP-glucose 4-epimerase [Deltaproteobacteria bacterium]|nr:MAG: UDP-glucose 4-epimerase [Deltaproteobacteria bacterium GWA2_55_82]OGQ63535.1 MAG: UDP-glucose 4-epimerase [Deltaproteobacteria bacterium RIFCSPLOWO2_02_FULL_55_12]OIJ74917.1 MAG: UDP-glucose 4-epimerase [Deltaproteobacteria bacterium GWC2_55_46]HBG47429.1 UDP-glucose 4-epimerase [Deltaproteobacteria bacterium]HCY11445.1 UDP-glucose 4-epimerase [Deltaproteobacteria bacterium]
MKALVTGGAGFIGSHVAEELLRKKIDCVVLDDLSGGFKENVPDGAEFVCGSILDEGLVNRLFAEHRFDYVYHLAAYAAEGLSHFIKRFNYQNNLLGSVNIINASVNFGAKCLVFTSSIAVYGKNQLPMSEDLTPTPEDPYGIAKYAVEQELKVSKEMFGLDYIIFRPHNVYGERQNTGDRYRNVIGIFMNQITQGSPVTVFGDGEQTRAFSYVGDVAPVIAASAFKPECYGHVFNIGADEVYTVNELAKEVFRAIGTKTSIDYLAERKEVKHAYSDHRKVREFFGDRKRTALREGLAKMAGWVKEAGCRESPRFENIEIRMNLPEVWTL